MQLLSATSVYLVRSYNLDGVSPYIMQVLPDVTTIIVGFHEPKETNHKTQHGMVHHFMHILYNLSTQFSASPPLVSLLGDLE